MLKVEGALYKQVCLVHGLGHLVICCHVCLNPGLDDHISKVLDCCRICTWGMILRLSHGQVLKSIYMKFSKSDSVFVLRKIQVTFKSVDGPFN